MLQPPIVPLVDTRAPLRDADFRVGCNTMSNSWLRQPSTITGLATAGGAILAVIAQYLTGSTSFATMLGVAAFSLAHLVIDDNTADAAIQTFVTDAVQDAVDGHLTANLPRLLNDAVAMASALAKPKRSLDLAIPVPASGGAIAAGLGGVLILCGVLAVSACSPAAVKKACDADAALHPLAVQLAPIVGGIVAGPEGAASAEAGVTLDAPLHAAIVADCAVLSQSGTAVNGVPQPPDPVAPAAAK